MVDNTCIGSIASGDLNLDEEQCTLFTSRRTLSMIIFIITILIYIPIMCYGVYRIYFYRETIVMQKRHVILSEILAIGYIVQILNCSLLTLSRGSYIKWSTIGKPLYVVAAVTGICLNYITAIKIWIHYYDITFNRVLMLNSWTSIIDVEPRYKFWIKNKNRWGNIKFLSKRVIIFAVLMFIILMSITAASVASKEREISAIILNMITIICLVIPIAFALIIGVKLPAFHDHFSIKNETKYICLTVVTTAIITVVQQFLALMSTHVMVIGAIVIMFVINTAALIINYFLTLYVVKQNHKLLKQCLIGDGIIQAGYQSSTETGIELQQVNTAPTDSTQEELFLVTNDFERIELLGNHLIHEFSIEILASLIEFIQYKRAIEEYIKNNISEYKFNESNFDTSGLYEFHSIVPRSNAVYGELNENEQTLLREHASEDGVKSKMIDLKIRAHNIYKRYIEVGAMHEINLSEEKKEELIHLMENIDGWLNKDVSGDNEQSLLFLFNLFNSSIDEMKELLEYSFVRLRSSIIFLSVLCAE